VACPSRPAGRAGFTDRIKGLLAFDGVKLVISDAHEGIKAAVSKIFTATPPGPAGPVSCRDRMNGLLAIHG
jgi:hypothetical protein